MVINDFVEQHPDILKVVSIEKNVGLGVALNVGLQFTAGNGIGCEDGGYG